VRTIQAKRDILGKTSVVLTLAGRTRIVLEATARSWEGVPALLRFFNEDSRSRAALKKS
jgi:hypothetical protein